MKKEIEVKFLAIDHQQFREILKSAGATLEQPMQAMRRTLLDYPDKRLQSDNWGRLRVRDEGSTITFTYKRGGDSEYSDEIETTVGSYEETIAMMQAIGLEVYCTQESRRETWHLDDAEIVLDEWPFLTPYIEIEGPSEAIIKSCSEKLGLSWADCLYGNIDVAYRRDYPNMSHNETVGAIPELRFDGPLPTWLAERA